MRCVDLGQIKGPFLVFGGPYSNFQATEALIAAASGHNIPPENCICTGDIVAYCGAPVATIAAIRDFGCCVVAGNCEKQLAKGADNCGCGFEAGTTCDSLSAGWYAYADREVGLEARAWMSDLPDIITFWHEGRRYAVIHGGATDVARFLWPNSPTGQFRQEISALQAVTGKVDTVLAGHCGLAFGRDIEGTRWINAGVIGMPPHDGRIQTRYAVIDESDVTFNRLDCNTQAAIEDMQNAGLTQGYHTALRTGVWPSEDVLPNELRLSAHGTCD